MKIETLTTQQKAMMPAWRDKWVAKGLSTDPVDFEKIEAAAMAAYDLIGANRPLVLLRVSSPYAASVAGAAAWLALKCASGDKIGGQLCDQVVAQVGDHVWDQVRYHVGDQVREQVGDQVWVQVRDQVWVQVRDQVGDQVGDQVRDQVGSQVWDQVWAQVGDQVREHVWGHVWDQVRGQVRDQVRDQVKATVKEGFHNYGGSSLYWAEFCSYVSFFRDACDWHDPILEKFAIAERLTEAGWTWWHSDVFVSSDRPAFIHRDDEGRLHSETGHAIEYRDGWGFSCWHGVRIPDAWLTDKSSLTPELALTWENIEQRRCACEILGWSKVLATLNARVIDADDPEIGELLEAEIPGSGKERFLRVRCGTGRTFVLPVPRDMKTALEANGWTYGISTCEYKPEVRT